MYDAKSIRMRNTARKHTFTTRLSRAHSTIHDCRFLHGRLTYASIHISRLYTTMRHSKLMYKASPPHRTPWQSYSSSSRNPPILYLSQRIHVNFPCPPWTLLPQSKNLLKPAPHPSSSPTPTHPTPPNNSTHLHFPPVCRVG